MNHAEQAAAAYTLDLLSNGPMYEASLRMRVNAHIQGMARLNTQDFRTLMGTLENQGKLQRTVTLIRDDGGYDDRVYVSVTYGPPQKEVEADTLSISH